MSVKALQRMWLATCDDIADVRLRERVQQTMAPEANARSAHHVYAGLYARYVRIVNRLGELYDQTLQVQKRAVVRRILEAATRRLMELQTELRAIELSEFVYVDRTLVEEKYTVDEVQLLVPFYYPMVRPPDVQAVIDGKRSRAAQPETVRSDDADVPDEKDAPKTMIQMLLAEQRRLAELEANRVDPWADAIRMLQLHEKARQARCQFTNIRMHPERYRPRPPAVVERTYAFYHKAETPMSVPVRRTVYASDCYKQLRTYSQVEFYVDPGRLVAGATDTVEVVVDSAPVAAVSDVDVAAVDAEVTQSDVEPIVNEEAQHLARTQRHTAATRIQRCFLRWRNKRSARSTDFRRLVNLNMVTARRWDFASRQGELLGRQQRSGRKRAFDEAFRRACEDTRARIVLVRSAWLAEDISDHIRAWFREMWLAGVEREFDKFPPAAKGGTILVLRGETPSPAEFYAQMERRDQMALMSAEQRKKMLQDERQKVLDAKMAAKKERQKRKRALAERKAERAAGVKCWYFDDETFRTKNFVALDQQMSDYERDWRFVDEAGNHQQAPYMDWVEETEYAQVHIELRQVIDALMRVEYELLQQARSKDVGIKYVPPKEPKPKKAKRGKRRQRADVPITFGDRDAQQVYDSMVADGVIRAQPPQRRIDDFIGDRNYAAFEMRHLYEADPLHGHGELRDVVRHHILGMGDVQFKHPKSMCLVGPPGCGKKFLVDALATEIGVVKFDLSASVCVRFADNMGAFVQDVCKMARLLQPAMLFIDGAHKPFIKRIAPGGEAEQPRLLGPFVTRILKALKPTDRVMLVGTTNEPWNADAAAMKKCWELVLLCPGADYGTTLLTWQTALQRLLDDGPLRLMDVSALSMVTKYYGIEQMLAAAERVVDLKRRVHLDRSPLTVAELLEDLLTGEPPNLPMINTDMAKYLQFYTKTNKLAKLRAKTMQDKLAGDADKKKKK